MPKIPTPAAKPLQVRTRIWHRGDQPRVEAFHAGKWQPLSNLADARKLAAKHGYAGIRVTPV